MVFARSVRFGVRLEAGMRSAWRRSFRLRGDRSPREGYFLNKDGQAEAS